MQRRGVMTLMLIVLPGQSVGTDLLFVQGAVWSLHSVLGEDLQDVVPRDVRLPEQPQHEDHSGRHGGTRRGQVKGELGTVLRDTHMFIYYSVFYILLGILYITRYFIYLMKQ